MANKNQEYTEQYADYAMAQMRRYGIPASVTLAQGILCLLYTSPSPRDRTRSRMPSSA